MTAGRGAAIATLQTDSEGGTVLLFRGEQYNEIKVNVIPRTQRGEIQEAFTVIKIMILLHINFFRVQCDFMIFTASRILGYLAIFSGKQHINSTINQLCRDLTALTMIYVFNNTLYFRKFKPSDFIEPRQKFGIVRKALAIYGFIQKAPFQEELKKHYNSHRVTMK